MIGEPMLTREQVIKLTSAAKETSSKATLPLPLKSLLVRLRELQQLPAQKQQETPTRSLWDRLFSAYR